MREYRLRVRGFFFGVLTHATDSEMSGYFTLGGAIG